MNGEPHPTESAAPHVHAVGGALCLDFANTVSGFRETGEFRDDLADYGDLLRWSEGVGAVSGETARRLVAAAAAAALQAQQVFARAIELREAIYAIFLARLEGVLPAEGALACLNRELGLALPHLRLQPDPSGFTWTWEEELRALDQLLWPIARSAAQLLTEGELDRVRQCDGVRCGWLFVDRSKNRSRRWCDMKDCGNVAKARRYRRRRSSRAVG